jgi:hypothetical protein
MTAVSCRIAAAQRDLLLGPVEVVGVGVLDVPFTLPAASAKRRRGSRRSTCFTSGPPGRSARHVGESECHGTHEPTPSQVR